MCRTRYPAGSNAYSMVRPAIVLRPVRVGTKEHWETIHPTTEWQTMKTPLTKDQFEVATDLYYIDVSKT